MARRKGSVGSITKAEILSKALPLFAEFGYAAVSTRMIADAVNLNVGALYNHFSNKQQILVHLLSTHMDDLLTAWNEIDLADRTAAQKLDGFVRFHIAYNIERADEVFISYMELRSLDSDGHALIEKQRQVYENIVRDILIEGQKSGQFTLNDPHIAAMFVLGSLVGINTWYRAKGRLPQSKIEDYYVAMSLRSVGFTPEGGPDV